MGRSASKPERPLFQSEVLGALHWDEDAEAWVAQYDDGDRRIRVVVDDGDDRPETGALVRAEQVFTRWPEYRQRIAGFCATEAESQRLSGLYDEVLSLHVDEVVFPIAHGDDPYIAVWFEGSTGLRQWHLEFDEVELRHFGFQWG